MGYFSEYIKEKRNETSNNESNKQGTSGFKQYSDLRKKGYDPIQAKDYLDINFDTLQSDMTSLNDTIKSVYGGWQPKSTMKSTRSSIQNIYDRLGKYEEFYGVDENITKIRNSYKSVLDDWDDLSKYYGGFKSKGAYDTAKKESKEVNDLFSMPSVSLKKKINETNNYKKILEEAEKYNQKVEDAYPKAGVYASRNADYQKTINDAIKERDNYLESQGFSNMDELEKKANGIAYTTSDGKNITWQQLYDKKRRQEKDKTLFDEAKLNTDEFEKYKTEGANLKNPTYDEYEGGFAVRGKNILSGTDKNIENIVEYTFENQGKIGLSDMSSSFGDNRIYYLQLTNEERDLYNYYLGKERAGLLDKGTADKYLKYKEDELKDRHHNKNLEFLTDFTDEHPVIASGVSVWQNLGAGAEWLGDSIKYATTGELDKNQLAEAASTIRGRVSENYDWMIRDWDAFDFLYNTGMSMVDSGVAMTTLGSVGGVALGMSAAAQGTNDALERGLDNKGAFWNGFYSGVFEGVFESLSIGNFKALKDAPVGSIKDVIKNVGKSMLVNASEETFTELANITYDKIVNGDFSNAETKIRAYVNSGMSEVEARRKVSMEMAQQVVESGASGALMGLGFGGISGASAYNTSRHTGADIKTNERVSDMFDLANNPEIAEAYETYTRYAKKGITADNVTNAQLGRLYNEVKSDAVEKMNSKNSTDEQRASGMQTLGKLALMKTENTIAKEKNKLNVGEETKVTETGEAVDVKALKVKGEDVVLNTEKGEVSTDKITLADTDADIVAHAKVIARTDGENIANLFLSQYNGETNIDEYANSFNLTVAYAKNDFRFNQILENKGNLSTDQVNTIYAEARKIAVAENEKAIAELNKKMADGKFYKGIIDESVINYGEEDVEGKVKWTSLTSRQRQAVTFIKGFAQATGMNLILKHNPKSDTGGAYSITSNTITIDISKYENGAKLLVETIIPTMSHETTHWMKNKSPELWENLNKIVFSTLTEHYNSNIQDKIALLNALEPRMKHTEESVKDRVITEDDIISAEVNKSGNPDDISREEIIARACEDMLSMSEQGRKIFKSLSESEQKTLVEKIKAIINDLLNWVDELLHSYKSTSKEAQIMREYQEELQKAMKVWDKMLETSVVANQSLEKSGAFNHEGNVEDVRFQTRFVDGNEVVWIDENILKENKGQPIHQFIADFIAEHIGEVYTIIESGQKVYIGEDLPGEYTQSKYTKRVLEKNPNIIRVKNKAVANIKEMIEIATKRKWEKAEHTENKDAKYGIYKYNTRFGFPKIDLHGNVVGANIYNAKLVIRNASNGKKYLYDIVSIKKDIVSSAWLSEKITSPTEKSVGQKNNISNNSILNPDENVKVKFSKRDSNGKELSKEQMEYFKDSVMRDEDGNLLVMYRGDTNEFTVFDRKKTNYANLYGRGFYFTKNKSHAEQYGKSKEYYLNIKNPLSPKQNDITKVQMHNFLKAIENDGEDYDLYNYGQDASAESVLNSVWGKDDFAMLQDISASAIGDLVATVELFNEINGTTYDGIVIPTETVTFNSEQAKLTSNVTPTKNKDVRFSMRDKVEETKDLVAVHNLSAEKLLKTLKLGGLPMPSIAITRAKEGHNSFGDISLVFGKDTIDPQFMRSNKIFSGDAWTPTYPYIEYKVNEKALEKINKNIYNLVPRDVANELGGLHLDSYNVEHELNRSGDITSSYRYNYAMKYAFLKDNNTNIELPKKEKPFYRYGEVSNNAVISFAHRMVEGLKTVNYLLEQHSSKLMADTDLINGIAYVLNEEMLSNLGENTEAYKNFAENPLYKPEDIDLSTVLEMLESARKYFNSNGKVESIIDYKNAKASIDEYFNSNELQQKYESWLKELFADIIGKEGIRNNKDTFTPSGNRRSFEALHYEHNLENVIKAMKEEGTKGIGGFGGGNIFGASTTEYGSISEVKNDAKKRMQNLSESEYEEIKKGFSDRFFELANSLPIHKNSFSATDDAANMLIEAVSKFKTKSGMANYLRTESKGWANYSDYVVDDLINLVNDIRNMPVAYFEAKPQRAVGYDEIKAVIIPKQSTNDNDLSKVKSELKKLGVPILEYEKGNNQSRIDALNSLEEVRFSKRDTSSVYDTMGETERVTKENEKFKAEIERLKERLAIEKRVTKGKVLNDSHILKAAGHLRNISNSNIDKVSLAKKLKALYTFINQAENITWEEVYEYSYTIADAMLKEATPEKVIDDYSKHILREIKSKRISFSEAQKKEAQYIFGKNWNRNFFGRTTITDSGISLERQWQEWANEYPDIFNADITDTDMPGELYDIIGTLQDASETIAEYDMAERTRWLANEVYNQYWNISNITTTADKYDKRIKLLNAEHRRNMTELRENYNTRLKEQHNLDKEKQKKLVKEIRERKDKQIALAKQHGKERLDKYKDNAQRKTYIQRITANALTLNKWLKTNSKDYHIHEAMKGPVIKLLNAIDLSSKQLLEKGIPTMNDISFNEAFSEVKSMLENATNMVEGFEELYGHDLAESIDLLSKAAFNLVGDNNYVINAMNSEQLMHLDKLVRHIKKVVTDLNKFHVLNHNKGAINLANEFMEHGAKLGNIKNQHGKWGKLFEFRNRTPYYFFKTLGEVGEKLFTAFQDGWDKLAFNAKRVIDYAEETYTAKEVNEWSKETKSFTLEQIDGNRTFEMSIAQIMALHCVSKQADAQRHLLSGGMTLKRIDKKGHVVADYENITLSPSDLTDILSSLTDRQKEVADKLQEFMNTVCAEWGNEISMARFGIEQFGIPDYFPIKVSEATVPTDNTKDIDNASLFRLLNMSFTKARNDNAEQSIEIGDIFDVFAQHSSDMAKYNALALPVLDFNKFYSIQGKDMANKEFGVVKTLKSVFGDEANTYLRRFVRDINGSQNVSRDVIGNTFFKNAKLASVAANLRVVLLQPTAFFKASAILDNKYLLKASAYIKLEPIGMVKKLKKAIANAEKYCGIVQWKSLGYYDTDISKGLTEKIKHAETIKDKAVEKSLLGAEIADKVTFGTLWVACEFEIRDTRKDLNVGSEEFYKAIATRLREVIYATQVVDSTMTRSDMMRSPDKMDKMYTTFGSEPTIAYNMLLDCVSQIKNDTKEFGLKNAITKNTKKARKVVAAYVITNVMAALVESGFDAFRDDDDEEMSIEEFMKLYFKNFAFDMSIGNKLPYIKEVYSIMQGYSSSRMDTQWMQYLYSAITTHKPTKAIKDVLRLFSQVTGLPFYNLFRDTMAATNKLGLFTTEDLNEMFEDFLD